MVRYYVDTVGKNAKRIQEYIRNQLEEDLAEDQMSLKEYMDARQLCEKMNISQAEFCRRIGQTPQNFNQKLKRGTVSFEEMMAIAEVLSVRL